MAQLVKWYHPLCIKPAKRNLFMRLFSRLPMYIRMRDWDTYVHTYIRTYRCTFVPADMHTYVCAIPVIPLQTSFAICCLACSYLNCPWAISMHCHCTRSRTGSCKISLQLSIMLGLQRRLRCQTTKAFHDHWARSQPGVFHADMLNGNLR